MENIVNPVLRGFNPDPSILRVGDDYYIATSTFEWFPGVQIHHSKDLRHWQLLTHPLTRTSQLDMIGDPDSGGVWAPCLTYSDGTFYLIYTDVLSHLGPFKDTPNYLVTADDIMGPWSDPIYLNSSGFDPSLFHDDDGKKWLLNMVWDHRKGKNHFGGILLQEYSVEKQCLVGPVYNIFRGTELGLTEGPHIYKHGEYYYLMVAEGGTRMQHAVTVARSKSLFGPYEADALGPVVTSSDNPDLELQRAGHASLVETQAGEAYIAHLCGRPLRPSMCCNLGRETALQKVAWTEDGWLRLVDGGHSPAVEVAAPELPDHLFAKAPATEHFDTDSMSLHLNSLREPIDETWASTKVRQGYLRLIGRESLSSTQRQSMIARRQQSFVAEIETGVTFSPVTFQQMAGLIYYYNTKNYYYLHITHDEELGKCLSIMQCDRGKYDEPLDTPIALRDADMVYLKAKLHYESLQFAYSLDGDNWTDVGPVLDASKISDENVELVTSGYRFDQGFTGAFIGMCAQDVSGQKACADFDYFTYVELD